jgi:hypothetical protein
MTLITDSFLEGGDWKGSKSDRVLGKAVSSPTTERVAERCGHTRKGVGSANVG